MAITHPVETALIEQASSILAQRELGNASTARAMFNQVPGGRKPLVIYHMIMENDRNDNPVDIYSFLLSVST
jgi:hypothetical protein